MPRLRSGTSSIALHAPEPDYRTQSTIPDRALYSPREAEDILSVSHAHLYRLIAAGKLDARKSGSKTLITRQSIERFIAGLPAAQVRSAQ